MFQRGQVAKDHIVRHHDAHEPFRVGHGGIGKDLVLAVLFQLEIAGALLRHLREVVGEDGQVADVLAHALAVFGGHDDASVIDDVAGALTVIFQFLDLVLEHVEENILTDGTAEAAVGVFVRCRY